MGWGMAAEPARTHRSGAGGGGRGRPVHSAEQSAYKYVAAPRFVHKLRLSSLCKKSVLIATDHATRLSKRRPDGPQNSVTMTLRSSIGTRTDRFTLAFRKWAMQFSATLALEQKRRRGNGEAGVYARKWENSTVEDLKSLRDELARTAARAAEKKKHQKL